MAHSGKLFTYIITYDYLEWIAYCELGFNRFSGVVINDHDRFTQGSF